MRCCDNEAITFNIFMLNDLNRINQSLVSNNKHFLNELAFRFLIVKIYVCYIPDFHLTGSVAGHQRVVIISYCTRRKLVILWMVAVELERWLIIRG